MRHSVSVYSRDEGTKCVIVCYLTQERKVHMRPMTWRALCISPYLLLRRRRLRRRGAALLVEALHVLLQLLDDGRLAG